MKTHIRFLGIAAYEITLPGGQVVLIDPCLNENPASPIKVDGLNRVDLILVTHLAVDHLGIAAEISKRFQCPVVCGPEVAHFLKCQGVTSELMRTVSWHSQVNPLGIVVRSIPSMHSSVRMSPDGTWLAGTPMGFILQASEDCRIYHSGDSAIYSDLKLIGQLYKPNVGLLCACELECDYLLSLGLKDHYGNEMSGDEGALAARWLKLEFALCCHYLNSENREDVRKFVSALSKDNGPKPIILQPGQIFSYPPEET